MQTFGHTRTKHMAENPIQFVWERPKADQYGRTSHTKYMRTTIGAGGKKYGPIGYLRRHSTPREVSGDACRVRWSGVAINATNRVHQCVFSPLSYWIYGGAAGDEYIWLLPTSAAMLDHPTRRAPPHRSCGRQWRTGRASWPYFFPPAPVVVRTYFVWEVRPYWSAFGLSHTNCMGFSPYI